MAIDLRPRWKAPSTQDFYKEPAPVGQALQLGVQGFQAGQQMQQEHKQRKAKAVQVAALQKAYPEYAPLFNTDNIDKATEKMIEIEEKKHTGVEPGKAMGDIYFDQSKRSFSGAPVQGGLKYTVPQTDIVRTLSGQDSQAGTQSRLDEMIAARTKAQENANQNAKMNRLLRIAISQSGLNFKTDKARLDNVVKTALGQGIETNPDEVRSAFEALGGDVPAPGQPVGSPQVDQEKDIGGEHYVHFKGAGPNEWHMQK